MASVEELLVKIDASTEQLRREMKRADDAVGGFQRNVDQHLSKIDKSFEAVDRMASNVLRTVGALFAAKLGGDLVNTLRQTEVQMSQLRTATGSLDVAKSKFQELADFAAQTPYAIGQSVDAFVKLKNLGLDPSIDALTSYGNTAAAMGKDLNQMIEAVADASTGQFERLLDFGIKAKSEGDKVSFTFQGVTTTIGKNAAEIEAYLRGIGDINFGDAMKDRAKTLDGALSNLGDSFTRLAIAIGDAGLTTLIQGVAEFLSNAAADMVTFGKAATAAYNNINGPIAKLNKLYEEQFELQQKLNNLPGGGLGKTGEEIDRQLLQVEEKIYFYEQLIQNQEDVAEATETETVAVVRNTAATKEQMDALDKLQAKYDDTFAALQKYEAAQADLSVLYKAGRIDLDEWTDALNAQMNALDSMDGAASEAVAATTEEVNVMATAFEEAVKRMDNLFVDMWRNILSGARTTFDGVKDMLRNLGAELLHANITRPLLGSLTGALGIAGSASAGTAGMGDIGSLLSTGSNLLSLGGNALTSIGTGAVFSGLGSGLGMATANIGAAGYFGGMGANMALAGSSLSTGAIGTALGAAIPYLAPVVALAAILPGLLKDKTDPRVGLKTGGEYFEDGVTMDSAFGTVGYRSASHGMKAGDEGWSAVLQTVVSLDNAVASLMSDSQVADTRSRLHGYMGSLTDIDDLGEFGISEMISERMRVVVEDMTGVMGDAFRAVFSGFEVSVEDLVSMVDGLVQLSAQLDVDVMEEYQRAAAEAGRSLTDVYHDQVSAVRDLAADLTISAEGIHTLTAANAARMQVELQLLAALDAAAASIDQTLGATIERITLDLLDQQGQYERIRGQAEALAESLNLMTDPTQIQDAVAEIDRLTNAAYGLLDETQRADMGREFVSFLQDVQGLAESRLDEARQDVASESAALRDVIESALATAASQFSAAASAMQAAAASMQGAANSMPRVIRVEWDVAEVNG